MENSAVVLVTGGTGTVGVNCILQLLQKGYTVRTTLRSLSKKDQVINMLKNGGISSPEDHLSFFKADLSGDANWQTAVKGCTYVLHVASPTHIGSEDESEMTRNAVDGVLRC
jgi:nucleoside-diphosphate-sugar epimerase